MTVSRWITIPRVRLAQLEDVELQVAEGEILACYGGRGRREWVDVGTWLLPGDRIVVLRSEPGDEGAST
jgi:hypothetical protein